MKQLFILYIALVSTIASYAQTITVMDKESDAPMDYVTLFNESSNTFAVTNLDGQADIAAFKDADRIDIRSFGYKEIITSYAEIVAAGLEVRMEVSNLELEEIVISGTRWRQSSYNIPSKITSISKKDIALQNPQTAADLLSLSGKVYIQKSQQGGGSPIIRGFATNRLLYTIDGIRMNTAIFRGGNIQNVISLDPFATEKTEVLFGPGSVIYGSDAIGGVMSFLTLTPQLSLTDETVIKGKVLSRFSSANKEKTGHFDINIAMKKWSFVSSISAWDYDHLRQGSNGPDDYLKPSYVERGNEMDVILIQNDPLLQIPTAYSQLNAMQKIRYSPNAQWDIQYGFHFSRTSSYGRYDRHNRQRNNLPRYGEWNYGPQKWMMNNLNITHSDSIGIYDNLSLRLAIQSFGESRMDRNFNRTERTINTEGVTAYSANLDFTKGLSHKNILYYGLEYVLNDVSSEGELADISSTSSAAGPARYPNATWSSIAAYVNDEYKVTDKFSLQGGLRYNQFILNADFANNQAFYNFPFTTAKINNGAVTGSIGGVYRPSESIVLSSNFGTAFRSPNVDDIGKVFDSEEGRVTVPNPDLRAEYATNVDVGIAKIFGESLKIDLAAYRTKLRDALVRRNFQLNGQDSILYLGEQSQVQAIQNAATANVYGVQVGLEMNLPGKFIFASDFNYQKGEEELDDGATSPSRHAVPFFGTARLSYKTRQLHVQLYAAYQAERSFADLAVEEQTKNEIYAKDDNGNNYSPSWYTLNLKARYDLSNRVKLNAGVENITDQRYRPYSSGVSSAGRNITCSVQLNF